jgi:hypothetical protein
MMMDFDAQTFGYLLTSGFIGKFLHTETSMNTVIRVLEGLLMEVGAWILELVLHYLNFTMRKISLQQIFAIIPVTVLRCITFGSQILLSALKNIPEAKIMYVAMNSKPAALLL